MLARTAKVREVVTQLAFLSSQLVQLLLVDDETTCSTIADNEADSPNTQVHASAKEDTDAGGATSEYVETNAKAEKLAKKGQYSLKVGDKVMVVRADKYNGRRGTVVSRRGTMFWNVQLDALGSQPAERIFKMASSLKVVK
jgi:hypothetical protein